MQSVRADSAVKSPTAAKGKLQQAATTAPDHSDKAGSQRELLI